MPDLEIEIPVFLCVLQFEETGFIGAVQLGLNVFIIVGLLIVPAFPYLNLCFSQWMAIVAVQNIVIVITGMDITDVAAVDYLPGDDILF